MSPKINITGRLLVTQSLAGLIAWSWAGSVPVAPLLLTPAKFPTSNGKTKPKTEQNQ
jgi:hypothetical protein